MPRPRIEIDTSEAEKLAAQGLTQAEICLCLGISESTLYRRKADMEVLTEAIKKGKAKAASVVGNKLFEMAKGGDLGAIIWYEKTRRGLSDKVVNRNEDMPPIPWERVPEDVQLAFMEGRITLADVYAQLQPRS